MSLPKPYEPHEDEIIRIALETRSPGVSQRKAILAQLHQLPGRTADGALYRYHQIIKRNDLAAVRKERAERKRNQRGSTNQNKQPYSSRAGIVLEAWSPEEDAILWNAVQMRPEGMKIGGVFERIQMQLIGRTFSSIQNRYYSLKLKFDQTPTAYIPSERPQPSFEPYIAERPYIPAERPQPVNEPQEAPEPVPTIQGARPGVLPPQEQPKPVGESSGLAERAEEFIRSLYGVVEENAALRSQVKELESLASVKADLEAERAKNIRLRQQVAVLEDDRDAFLRLMDKARVIGREENGI